MKCIVCHEPATIRISRHNATFCEEHFIEHIHRQVLRVIKKYSMFGKSDRIILAVSGGKDSLGTWKILLDLGFRVIGVHINNGFGKYSELSEQCVRDFANAESAELKVYQLEELIGFDFKTALKYTRKSACSLCGSFKRYNLNRIAIELAGDVLATAHNLDDETAFLLGNILYWHSNYLKKQHPVLEAEKGLVKKVKPIVRITDEEMRRYSDVMGIQYIQSRCPYVKHPTTHFYKEIMDELQAKFPSVKGVFYFGFVEKILPCIAEEENSGEAKKQTHYCSVCGYKTILPDKCFICTLKELVKDAKRT